MYKKINIKRCSIVYICTYVIWFRSRFSLNKKCAWILWRINKFEFTRKYDIEVNYYRCYNFIAMQAYDFHKEQEKYQNTVRKNNNIICGALNISMMPNTKNIIDLTLLSCWHFHNNTRANRFYVYDNIEQY